MFWRNRPATRRLAQAWADLRVWPHHLREEGTYFSDQVRRKVYESSYLAASLVEGMPRMRESGLPRQGCCPVLCHALHVRALGISSMSAAARMGLTI